MAASGWFRPSYTQVLPSHLDYPGHHLPWYTFEGDHFMVHYQLGNSHSAQLTLLIAEEIYKPITDLYRFEPDRKTNIILRDRADISNGAAYFFDNKIEIWVPSIDTPFRGTHQWLKNVITHEFTHMVQLGASMRRSSRVPAIYLQWFGYEDVRRPDVLYGFPNSIITYPLATVSIPAWFAEGTAQYQVNSLANDQWDSHRDMLLRTRILSGKALTLDEMNHFSSKNSLERELVYNQGYDFVRYLADRFGEDVLADLTHASASSGLNNFNKVMERVTGIKAGQLYTGWFNHRKTGYQAQTEQIEESSLETVSTSGFLNFYPQMHTQTGVFAYISNLKRDDARTSLILKHEEEESEQILLDPDHTTEIIDLKQPGRFNHGHDANVLLKRISNRPSFSPDGRSIAYTRPRLNRYGEVYQDLHIYNLDTKSENRITSSARLLDPDWHPAEDLVVAVQLQDQAQNLVLIDLQNGNPTQLTSFQSSETIYTPVWSADGNDIYFSVSTGGKRDIARLNPESGIVERLLSSPEIDFRDPFLHPDEFEIIFSSDADGFFNIYSFNLETFSVYRLTDLKGGAFMPHISGNTLYFSHFQWDGYKIAIITDFEQFKKTVHATEWIQYLQQPGEEDSITIDPFTSTFEPLPFDETGRTEPASIVLNGKESFWRPYSETTTRLNIYPVIRFDNYTQLNGRNSRLLTAGKFGNLGENIMRDFKAGTYLAFRDVTERLSLFGGALFGPGSVKPDKFSDLVSPTRLNNLDRDLFLMIDYRGVPFIKRSWSPTISIEIYNLKRNVRDGLFIEEFPCTSCLPIERGLDIRYSMWEASLYLRSKLNRWSLLELGASYSPYSVTIDRFFSEEFRQLIPSTTSVYFKGSRFSASYIADLIIPDRHADIAPRGVRSVFTYRFEPGRLLQEFTVNDGFLSPVFSRDLNHSFELNNRFGFTLSGNSRALFTSRLFTYLNRPDNYFYLDYTGGMAGMRSYPYFALGGRHTYFTRASILFPLMKNINRKYNSAMVDKVYGHLFFEAGNGHGGPLDIGNRLKTGLGSELRIAFNNYYFFPMKLFLNTTYGLNRFEVTLPPQFITSDGGSQVNYGGELLFYIGLTFDFDI